MLAVNVSAKQFQQADFIEQVESAVVRHGIDPGSLKLELTETVLLNSIKDAADKMLKLKGIGIQFSLDDFGTGFSSLQYLKQLPLDQIKIDQSFVRDVHLSDNDRAIVQAIIAMAKSLGIDIIAEGVESADQEQQLQRQGCTQYQGYLYGKPMPSDTLDSLIRDRAATNAS